MSFTGGTEQFDDYTAGENFRESSQPFFDSGRITQADTIDDNFGFTFGAFPDPFNAPFTRTSADDPQLRHARDRRPICRAWRGCQRTRRSR